MSSDQVLPVVLEYKFDVSTMAAASVAEYFYSSLLSVAHNNVNLTFQFLLTPKDSRRECVGRLGVYIEYLEGPKHKLNMDLKMFVAVEGSRAPVLIATRVGDEFVRRGSGFGSNTELPNSVETLRTQGYLSQDDTLLHVFVILRIPEVAFDNQLGKYPPPRPENLFFRSLYAQINTPVPTNSMLSNRFELISHDGHHFWVHKDVLSFNSDAFKQMFDPNKPMQFDDLKEGQITMENLSGGALLEMLNFIYLRETTPDIAQFALELIPVTEMYGLTALLLLCEEVLIDHIKNEQDANELLRHLEFAHLHKSSQLEEVSVSSLEVVIGQQNHTDINLVLLVTEEANQHNYAQLKSRCLEKLVQHVNEDQNLTVAIIHSLALDASKYGMDDLSMACAQWLGRNWGAVAETGQLSDMIEDKTGGLFTQLMTLLLCDKQ